MTLFQPDHLSWIMAGLIIFVMTTVYGFSKRYMMGDRYYQRHLKNILFLTISLLIMVFADNLLVLLAAWTLSNLLLVRLMIHKKEWMAARASGILALKTFGIGIVLLAIGFYLLADITHTLSIHALLSNNNAQPSAKLSIALTFIFIAAMTQSAIYPFHRWLISSLNSPTPVSALMHAGLVNGGGFLLIRFAPLYLTQPMLLHVIFIAGLITVILGTFWKLIQTDIKRMLACSTMGQMGFMVMECGMGLFPLALSHLVWHGLFKAYLFLGSGAVAQEKLRQNHFGRTTFLSFILAAIFGLIGAYVFALTAGNIFSIDNTSVIMLGLAFMTCTQFSCNFLEANITLGKVILAIFASVLSGLFYGASIFVIDYLLAALNLFQPQALDGIYISGFVIIFLIWLCLNLNLTERLQKTRLWQRLYMLALNGSQPNANTITANRTDYQF